MTSTVLSEHVHPDIRWAAAHMPLLRAAFLEPEVQAAFRGLRVSICLHIEPKTGVLCALLAEAGALVTLTGSPGTTRVDIAEALRALGVRVFAEQNDLVPQVDEVLANRPHLTLDNGADLTTAVLAELSEHPEYLGGTEETTTGGILLRQQGGATKHPIIVINDSPLKLLVENRFGVGQSIVQGVMNATNLMIPGAPAVVIGYGPCGRGVANTLRELGARVTVVDIDPYRRLEAVMEGHQIADLDEALRGSRMLFLATGQPDVVHAAQLEQMADQAIVAGVGHFSWELNMGDYGELLPGAGGQQTRFHDRYRLPSGKTVVVLAGSRMINLVAAGGNPIEAMDLGLTLQARSLAAIARGAVAEPGVQAVPQELDRRIAGDFADAISGKLGV